MTLTLTRNHKTGTSYQDLSVAARAVDASKVYGKGEAEVRALDAINVEFSTSKFTAIMGPSGDRKSTRLNSSHSR